MTRKKYPIGIQTFQKIIEDGFTYVDKTALIYKLVTEGTVYFLSRPRRFGKSLLVSTLDAYFSGRKDLFIGLAIENLEKDWIEYPVFHFDFSGKSYKDESSLRQQLNTILEELETVYGREKQDRTEEERFRYLIRKAYEQTGRQVVVLVDEYDKPLLDSINNEELDDQLRTMLKSFYGVLKPSDPYLKFVLLTGVTKFSKVSIFSDLNHLRDISMLPEYATLCGISEDELETIFKDDIQLLAEENDKSYDEMLQTLRNRYDGYHFCEKTEGMYNPFSILNVFASRMLKDYWFQSGTPTFLIELLKRSHYNIIDVEGVKMDANDISNYRAEANNPIPIFYQAGYLTIKGYDELFSQYTLGYPNEEVRSSFLKFIAPVYLPPVTENGFSVREFTLDLMDGNIDSFMTRLKAFIAAMDYELFDAKLREKYFQTIFYLIFSMTGSYIKVEQHSSSGRMDAVVQTATHIYIFEFKLDKTADEALAQIEEKRYAEPFLAEKRQIVKIGANFNSTTHQLEEWKIENLNSAAKLRFLAVSNKQVIVNKYISNDLQVS